MAEDPVPRPGRILRRVGEWPGGGGFSFWRSQAMDGRGYSGVGCGVPFPAAHFALHA